MGEQQTKDPSDTPRTDAAIIVVADKYGGNRQLVVPAEFADAQERAIASHVDLMARLKDHMERMGFCTREEEPYLEELDEAIQKATQS
jgi:hypothetical protein